MLTRARRPPPHLAEYQLRNSKLSVQFYFMRCACCIFDKTLCTELFCVKILRLKRLLLIQCKSRRQVQCILFAVIVC